MHWSLLLWSLQVQEYNGRAQILGRVGRGRPCQFCMFARHADPAVSLAMLRWDLYTAVQVRDAR